jgi:uncharacterized protein (TIGR02391 family)
MNLDTLIQPDLWQDISNSYEAGNYRNSILDAMHYLTNILREKTGIDADGASLVGQALGGDSPKLKINKLQTESERDEQNGIMQILIGLYKGIRNPRSHEQKEDTENEADPIIYFIDYITKIINASKPPFSMEDFLFRVFELHFVENDRYAEQLVNGIPQSKLLDVLIEIYRRRGTGDPKKLKFTSLELIKRLSSAELQKFLSIVSDELETVSGPNEITSTIQMLPSQYWPELREIARMRIENRLIASIKVGEAILNTDRIQDGALGTWASGLVNYFTLRTELRNALKSKLDNKDLEDNFYVLKFFLFDLPNLFIPHQEIQQVVSTMHKVVEAGETSMKNRLCNFIRICTPEWKKEIIEQFQDLTDPKNPEFYLDDGTPFLGNVPETPEDAGDIPF